jgi:hypothetical protein
MSRNFFVTIIYLNILQFNGALCRGIGSPNQQIGIKAAGLRLTPSWEGPSS